MQLRFAQQMKKGALDMLVLKLLQHEEKYGYQLISELRDRSNGAASRIVVYQGHRRRIAGTLAR